MLRDKTIDDPSVARRHAALPGGAQAWVKFQNFPVKNRGTTAEKPQYYNLKTEKNPRRALNNPQPSIPRRHATVPSDAQARVKFQNFPTKNHGTTVEKLLYYHIKNRKYPRRALNNRQPSISRRHATVPGDAQALVKFRNFPAKNHDTTVEKLCYYDRKTVKSRSRRGKQPTP